MKNEKPFSFVGFEWILVSYSIWYQEISLFSKKFLFYNFLSLGLFHCIFQIFFREEKAQAVDDSLPKIVDSTLPGWGSWTSSAELTEKKTTTKTKRPRFNKRLLFKVPKAPPRKDANKGHVIINEEKSNKLKEHLVCFDAFALITCHQKI